MGNQAPRRSRRTNVCLLGTASARLDQTCQTTCPTFLPGDANLELSHAQACYEGIGQHQPAKDATHYAGIFCEFLENHQLALPCTYRKIHQGQRNTFKTTLKHGRPRRLDYTTVPKTWLAATTKSLVLEHFDAYTIIYDHKPVAVEIKGSLISQQKTKSPGNVATA